MKEQITTEMKSAGSLRVIFTFFVVLFCINLMAQSGLNIYNDLGENNVSQGLYDKSAALGFIQSGNNNLETGFQIDMNKSNKTAFSGYIINASRDFSIKGIPLELHGFWSITDFSRIMYETNWGVLLQMRRNHFEMAIGTNFRTYSFSRKAVKDYEIEKNNANLHEAYNIMYSFSYNLKPIVSLWNVGLSVTDIDYFIINQDTNPILNLYGSYKLSSHLGLYAEASYKMAGASNMAVNYFGFFLRTGISWNF